MASEIEQIVSDLDADTIADFMDSIVEGQETIAAALTTLETNPLSNEAINTVFRALHTIKGNAKVCGLNRLSDLAHAVENIFTEVRSGRVIFIPQLGEIILLSLDEFRFACEDVFRKMEFDTDKITRIIERLEAVHSSEREDLSRRADNIIALFGDHIDSLADAATAPRPGPADPTPGANLSAELALFNSLALRLEQKYAYWQGRTQRMLSIAATINAAVDEPVDPIQLEMAIYVHDIGMAFLPDSLVLKEGKFSEDERAIINSHPGIGASILGRAPYWRSAALIVEQHHERPDGKGTPQGLAGSEICLGARMLALVDAFESMTRLRPDRQFKRSVLRAVTEINNCAGTQFCPELVPIFNAVVRNLITH